MCKSGKLISIIMPVYNGETYLEETIQYILDSSYKNIELIIINDNSTDKSKEICERLQRCDSRIHILNKMKTEGVAEARNSGLLQATGECICFADQDDIISPELYKTLLDDYEKYKCEIVVSNASTYNGEEHRKCDNIKNSKLISKEERQKLIKYLIIGRDIDEMPDNTINPTIWNCMFSSELIKQNKIKFKSFVAYEDDWIFLIEALSAAHKVYLEEKALYSWRLHDAQTHKAVKYIYELAEKRLKHRQFVDEHLKKIDLSDTEKRKYDARHFGTTLFMLVYNEKMHKNISYAKSNILKGYLYEKGYVRDIPHWLVLRQVHDFYGSKCMLVVGVVLLGRYGMAMKIA